MRWSRHDHVPDSQLVGSFRLRHIRRILKFGDTFVATTFTKRHASSGTGRVSDRYRLYGFAFLKHAGIAERTEDGTHA